MNFYQTNLVSPSEIQTRQEGVRVIGQESRASGNKFKYILLRKTNPKTSNGMLNTKINKTFLCF